MPPMTETDFMALALDQAGLGAAAGEVPVGAVLVDGVTGEIVAAAHNLVESAADPTAHAEMLVLRSGAAKSGAPRLTDCDLYVTLEPCPMCAQAISFARPRRLYFGAYDPKGGGVDHGPRIFSQTTCHHAPEVIGGVNEIQCAKVLKDFFRERR